ncbi:MAG: excinuclease ABC subunit UvrA [bacterium]|nr:excinuclease ABC subunit UvrA [bacterium]
MPDKIIIKGARVHNLKNVSLEIPKNKLVVVTGLSGSGKSSLAFDTIYAEGQRRYAESLSSYARQFMEVRDKPDVDRVDGLSPTIAIDQKIFTQNPRSTVGTVTELYDYLRLLFARVGTQYCPDCDRPVEKYTAGEITETARRLARKSEVIVLSPLINQAKVVAEELIEKIEKSGCERVRINGEIIKINDLQKYAFSKDKFYQVELVTGMIADVKRQNPGTAVDLALDLSNGSVVLIVEGKDHIYSTVGRCPQCGRAVLPVDIRSFSFNSPYGACPRCTGLGITMEVDPKLVIPNPRLTLAEGAIQPWTRITGNQNWYQKMLTAVAFKHNFSMNTALSDFPKAAINTIMHGTGEEIYEIENKKVKFVGVLADMTARHLETDSEYVRREIEQYMREQICPLCHGKRLRVESLAVKIEGYNVADIAGMSVSESKPILQKFNPPKAGPPWAGKNQIAESIIREIIPRLDNLIRVGLPYLGLDRSMNTLSGGEVTRVRLATQLSSGLTGVIYILDEPSVGLHPRDNDQLITTLKYLRDLGNSVIVVEHDEAMMSAADYLVDIGPGAGIYGGEVLAAGTLAEIKKSKESITGRYLSQGLRIECERKNKPAKKNEKSLEIIGANAFNLKNVSATIPLGKLVCVTGVSGSGKSSLIIDVLGKALTKHFYRAKDEPGAHKAIKGLEHIDKVISIDQTPIGRTPRSNPATYTGAFTLIRDMFADLPEAKMRAYDAGKFSFNVRGGGRCEACAGEGYIRIPMQFLADVFVECNDCGGSRYNEEALEIHYHNKNIANVLKMTVEEAHRFFADVAPIANKLNVLRDVGLGYLELGQPATTLSGGEAQRIKLATELARASTGKTLYILDEPTTGLHFEDIKKLLAVLNLLVEKGNTVVIIEHNLDVIRCSDWVIDLGPEGGKGGGEIVAVGTPGEIIKNKKSWTGKYLR